MLDPARPSAVDLTDFPGYIGSCLELANQRLARYKSAAQAARAEDRLNRYPRLDSLEDPRDIVILDQRTVTADDLKRAGQALMDGKVLLEHTCAGEATRLGLGTKYLINPPRDLGPAVLARLLGDDYKIDVDPGSLRPMTLGRRHMLQMAWDLTRMARDLGRDPARALARQRLLVIVNQVSWQNVVDDFLETGFYGFGRPNVFFMVQQSFHGIDRPDGAWVYDTSSPRRLHNHGQMLMQTTMDNQVFRLSESGGPNYLTWAEYRMILGQVEDKVSFNIEDLDYLAQSLDLTGLAGALKLGEQGARMVMEVVANNPEQPQKGGLCAWDPELERDVMIESFQLEGVENSRINFLNKNINHYPRPAEALSKARERGLSMPLAVKGDKVYFQPVQGDLNFLVKTAFVRRAELKPISAWKSGANTPAALAAMARQEKRPGFIKWARDITGLDL